MTSTAGNTRLASQLQDLDPDETSEWVESLDQVIDHAGPNRARYLLLSVLQRARDRRVGVSGLRRFSVKSEVRWW